MAFSFVRPSYLFLLVLVPLLIFIHFIILRRQRSHALTFANFDAIARVKGIDILSKNLFGLVFTAIILVFLILSVSGLTYHRNQFASSFTFTIAIDSSRSMEANDFSPSRMEVAKEVAIDFVDAAPSGSKMAILSFAGNAFIEQDVTDSKSQLKQSIENIQISGVGGTDINEAIITSSNLIIESESKSIILISDGQINVGTIDDAIDYANGRDVIVHAIAMGTAEGGETTFGGLTKVDEDILKALAFNTGGQFFKAETRDELAESFREIMGLKIGRVSTDLTPYLILIAMILFVIEYLLVNTRYRVLP
jgi:Ca-activated chloride channel homolog